MKTIILVLLSISVSAQVYIPDNVFKTYLLSNPEINTTFDLDISYEEAASYTGEINLRKKQVYDLTGIEAFINITAIMCQDCQLTELDISENLNLEKLHLQNNFITELDIFSNINLYDLRLDNNSLTSLDASNSFLLETLTINGNSILDFNASYCTFLTALSVYNNDMMYLNLRNGNNENLAFIATSNPELCISVDNETYSNDNWGAFKDATARFSNNCTVGIQEKEITIPRRIPFDILGRTIGATNIYTPILQ